MKIKLKTEKADCLENHLVRCPYCARTVKMCDAREFSGEFVEYCHSCGKNFRLLVEVVTQYTTVPRFMKFSDDWNVGDEIEENRLWI